ncbi:Fur family transcriptional regulator [Enterococcus bulliens]|uniref:Fur family transcriptional regulator n=1 Tax=uncultured Enterococcus sp. TaxID=167972 RepID=UPI0025FD6172|nr:Fur family transcriptional regulator [uncultured Enterococcus sp.]
MTNHTQHTHESGIEQALELLKTYGFKYTKKREMLLTYLAKTNRYLPAREVYEALSQTYPNVSYDTIYRNLHDFSEIGIVEQTDLNGEMKFRFHCKLHGIGEHHHHFICSVCGKTKELQYCPMTIFEDQLQGCKVEGHRFEIYGRCEECQN